MEGLLSPTERRRGSRELVRTAHSTRRVAGFSHTVRRNRFDIGRSEPSLLDSGNKDTEVKRAGGRLCESLTSINLLEEDEEFFFPSNHAKCLTARW